MNILCRLLKDISEEESMHTAKALMRSYARKVAFENLQGRTLGGQNWTPAPNPAGRFYVELAMGDDGEPHPVENKKEKKNKKKEKKRKHSSK